MRAIGAEARAQGVDSLYAHIGLLQAPEQIMQQAFTQRAIRHQHALDAERLEHRTQDRHPTGQHRRAFRIEPGEINILHAPVPRA